MGNCVFGGLGEVDHGVIKVATPNGGIMEFYAPLKNSQARVFSEAMILFWKPLSHHEELAAGQSYHLLPLNGTDKTDGQIVRDSHIGSNSSIPTSLASPHRMSTDYQRMLMKRSYTEVFSRYNNGRFWKVKLVISPEQLIEILSQEARTQELSKYSQYFSIWLIIRLKQTVF
ncbi:hypothetical protein CJ030_MR7G014349 [Morella rubra]|uniref:Uncharacterized protein n=1 Tax=Morella rubra TaxID=262757 RepID=A0A6A1V0J3_9ROSI|nr:hypothetical protein CJ030_MR7G014321 [Morella rubra]KAB1206204.1 hypothetical protein CJ030_MR7G014349 [Morella rubra]